MNAFIQRSYPKEDALCLPNFDYISRKIPCDYVVHEHNQNTVITHPYAKVKTQYLALSERSYNDSHASQSLTCHEFADHFFFRYVDVVTDADFNVPFETRPLWPDEFKSKNDRFLHENSEGGIDDQMPPTRSSSEGKTQDWLEFIMNQWLYSKKEFFFSEVAKKADIMRHILPEYKLWLSTWQKDNVGNSVNSKEADFATYCSSIYTENQTTDVFNTNILRTMSIFLCGMSCESPSGELMNALKQVLKTNGEFKKEYPTDIFNTQLHSAWHLGRYDSSKRSSYEVRLYSSFTLWIPCNCF
jgi:hypothetical protein